MSKVYFEQEKFESKSHFRNKLQEKGSGLEHLVIKVGLARSAKGAKLVLLVLALGLLGLSFILFTNKDSAAKYGNYDDMTEIYPELVE